MLQSESYPSVEGIDFDTHVEPVETGQLEMLLGTDEDATDATLVFEIYGLFKRESLEKLTGLKECCARNDLSGVRRIVHFVAGSAGSLGIARMAAFLRAVEKAIDEGRQFDLDACEAAIQKSFELGCLHFEASLEQYS